MVSVRIRGGKRQPRYYYLKDRGAEDMVRYMSEEKRKESSRSEVQKRIDEMVCSAQRVADELRDIADRMK